MRAGTVRVRTYTQLFAAARILAMGRIPRGDRLAIVSNGHGPGMLAADSAAAAASRSPSSRPRRCARSTRCCRRGDRARAIRSTCAATRRPRASPRRCAAVLADPQRRRGRSRCTCRGRSIGAVEAAQRGGRRRARVDEAGARRVARRDRPAGGAARRSRPAASPTSTRRRTRSTRSRSSPRTAATRSGCSKCRRRSPIPSRPISPPPSAMRSTRSAQARTRAAADETQRLLAAFGIALPPPAHVATRSRGAGGRARAGLPGHADARDARGAAGRARGGLRDGRALARAWRECRRVGAPQRAARRVIVRKRSPPASARAARARSRSRPIAVFGPVIALGASVRGVARAAARASCCRRSIAGSRRDLLAQRARHRAADRGARARSCCRCRRSRARCRGCARSRSIRSSSPASAREIAGARVVVDRARKPAPRISPHGDPSVSGGARGHDHAARRHVARACGRSGPRTRSSSARSSRAVRGDALFPLLLPAARAHAGDARRASRRSTTTARWRSLALAPDARSPRPGDRRRSRATSRISTTRARSSRSSSPTRGRAAASRRSSCRRSSRARSARGSRALHGCVLRANQNMLRFVAALGFVVQDDRGRSGAGQCLARAGAADLEGNAMKIVCAVQRGGRNTSFRACSANRHSRSRSRAELRRRHASGGSIGGTMHKKNAAAALAFAMLAMPAHGATVEHDVFRDERQIRQGRGPRRARRRGQLLPAARSCGRRGRQDVARVPQHAGRRRRSTRRTASARGRGRTPRAWWWRRTSPSCTARATTSTSRRR